MTNLWNINLLACLIRLKGFISILTTLPLSENSKVIYLTFQVSVLLWHRASAILLTPPLMIYPTTPPPRPHHLQTFLKSFDHTRQTGSCSNRPQGHRNGTDSSQKFPCNYATSFSACRECERNVGGIFHVARLETTCVLRVLDAHDYVIRFPGHAS